MYANDYMLEKEATFLVNALHKKARDTGCIIVTCKMNLRRKTA